MLVWTFIVNIAVPPREFFFCKLPVCSVMHKEPVVMWQTAFNVSVVCGTFIVVYKLYVEEI